MVEREQEPNPRDDDSSNPQQGASSRNNDNHNTSECHLPTSDSPEQDHTALTNVPTHDALGQAHGINQTAGNVGSISTYAPAPPRQSLKIPPCQKDERKLFVGGLPADITDEEFRVFFDQFGVVIDSIVMIDYETNRSRGFGFVTFQDPNISRYLLSRGHDEDDSNIPPELREQARRSMSGRMQMRDKWIEIKAAEPKAGSSNGLGGRSRHSSGAPSRGGAAAGRSRNYAFPIRTQHGNYELRNGAPFIPPNPVAGQAMMTGVGNDPYNTPEYGTVPPATSYQQHGTTNPPQPPPYPYYYGQHSAPHTGVYAHPYYYPAPIMHPGGVHTSFTPHQYAAGFADSASVAQAANAIPADVDPSLTAVPMVQPDVDGADATTATHQDGVYPINFGYSYGPNIMPTPAHSSYGVTIVPVPLPHPSPMPVIQQHSVMQPVAPGIPGQSSTSSSKDETDSNNA
jgi:RNA recognition motif. (a.k.a. RRM, RBD, or RNP domain)